MAAVVVRRSVVRVDGENMVADSFFQYLYNNVCKAVGE